jgi:lactoylglutathione lyase
LHVRDVEASIQFYRDVLGLGEPDVLGRDDGGRPDFVAFTVGEQLIFLMQRPEYVAPADRKDRGLNHICLLVEPTEPEQLMAALRARGVTIRGTRVPSDKSSFSVYVEDPDGHGIELEQRVRQR